MLRLITVLLLMIFSYKLGSMDILAPSDVSEFVDERLVPLVERMPRNSVGPSYWFEKRSVLEETEWDKVILIFNYLDNSEVCTYISDVASREAPAQEFRCSSAN